MSAVTLATLRKLKQNGEKFASLTAYDASFARILDEAGVDVLLVGDSLGMVVQGHATTLPVALDEMVYHLRCVRRGAPNAFLIADMPFMGDATPEVAMASAARLMKEGEANMVKLEGGAVMVETVRRLASRGIPVCSHLGLLPQSVNKLGGYRLQGREEAQARAIFDDAKALAEAGADMLLLECVPRELARRLTEEVDVPVIGIGAGPDCDAQVLVLYDMLGITPGRRPKFSKDFLAEAGSVHGAVESYVKAVREGRFPADEHCLA